MTSAQPIRPMGVSDTWSPNSLLPTVGGGFSHLCTDTVQGLRPPGLCLPKPWGKEQAGKQCSLTPVIQPPGALNPSPASGTAPARPGQRSGPKTTKTGLGKSSERCLVRARGPSLPKGRAQAMCTPRTPSRTPPGPESTLKQGRRQYGVQGTTSPPDWHQADSKLRTSEIKPMQQEAFLSFLYLATAWLREHPATVSRIPSVLADRETTDL